MNPTICMTHTMAMKALPKGLTTDQTSAILSEGVKACVDRVIHDFTEGNPGVQAVAVAVGPMTTQVKGTLYLTVSVVIMVMGTAGPKLLVPNSAAAPPRFN